MAENPIGTPLPADLPENWAYGQTVAPTGAEAGLSEQHGYNYLMRQVNTAQRGINALGEALEDVPDLVDGKVPVSQLPVGMAGGVAGLDEVGRVPEGQLPAMDYIPNSQKGAANGVAILGADGKVLRDQLPISIQSYYVRFEEADWTGSELRVAQSVHNLPTALSIVAQTLHMLIGRSAVEYEAEDMAEAKSQFVAMEAAALAANTAAAGSYPTAADGHVELTFLQVQYYLLEGALAPAAEAAAKGAELGFDWQNRNTCGAVETVSLDALLAAAYTPALGGSSAALDNLWSLDVIRGLRLRKAVADTEGAGKKYDLDGRMTGNTWGVLESEVWVDTTTGELVLSSEEAFPGELLVIAVPAN